MPKRSSKRDDVNETAFRILAESTGEREEAAAQDAVRAAAAALGRLGGLKGGKARATALSPAKRRAIAKKGALARWGKKKPR